MEISRLREALSPRRIMRGLRERRMPFWADDLPNNDGEAFILDLRGEGPVQSESRVPGATPLPAVKAPHGRHRLPPAPVTVRFPSATTTIPRLRPGCGTRPPWDSASLPAAAGGTPESAHLAEDPGLGPEEPASPGSPSALAEPGQEPDELQQYLDGLPGYPDD